MLTLDLLSSAVHLFHMINEKRRELWPGRHVQCRGVGPVQRIKSLICNVKLKPRRSRGPSYDLREKAFCPTHSLLLSEKGIC